MSDHKVSILELRILEIVEVAWENHPTSPGMTSIELDRGSGLIAFRE